MQMKMCFLNFGILASTSKIRGTADATQTVLRLARLALELFPGDRHYVSAAGRQEARGAQEMEVKSGDLSLCPRTYVLTSRGGSYTPGSAAAQFDFQEN